MKQLYSILLILVTFLSSCGNSTLEEGEAASVTVSSVIFTQSLNKAKDLATVQGTKLELKAGAKSDNFRDPDGKLSNNSAPVLLSKVDNTKPFTFTAKVKPGFLETYDAGTMYVYVNEKNWVKFAFERDERQLTRMVTVRTLDTSDDNNHDVVEEESVYMKISSDTKTIGYYYSLDKTNWQLVRLYRNDYPQEIFVGLSTQSPVGDGTSATFDDCSLTESSINDFRLGI
ncbi:DUF1349 domain-containing protein [Pontibacter qinzhouensis]|uniref:DUF1349 domain-containing protein n=2 Tax=Pontibacter qinzhouensis TaxID=2603253 RepID=A0A5C8K6G4_9BACT|nr:DUF1349 domain-containing protein [Pontibacter qinzhouensis]